MKNFKGISIYLIICGLLLMGTGCSSLQNNQALKDELKTQVTNELKPQLKEELKQELKKELKEELTADLNKQAEQKAAAAPAPAASSTTNTPVKKTRHYTFWAEGAARIQTYDQVKKGTYASCQYVRQCSSCGKVQDNTVSAAA